MVYLVYILIFLLVIRFMVALINFLSRRYLPAKADFQGEPLVSVLIPARNEENNIGNLLGDLEKFNYRNLEVLVYDDHSTDATRQVVLDYTSRNSGIILIEGTPLPAGWLGKNHACHRLAQHACGDYFLFLDADVRVKDGLLPRSLQHMKNHRLQLLSIFPKQTMKSPGEWIAVPLMNWILLSLLPLILIRESRNPAFSAANGQFMCFGADTYRNIQPHKLFRNHKVEDIAINHFYKKEGLKTDTLLGDKHIECRMYKGLHESVNGFSKNIFQFFGNSMFLTLLFALATSLTPVLSFLFLGWFPGCVVVSAIVFLKLFVSLASRQPALRNILLIFPQHLVFWRIIVKAIVNHFKKELIWKGRNVLAQ